MNFLINIWNLELVCAGQTLITFFVFSMLFMIWGKFRFCFISNMIFIFYLFFIKNAALVEREGAGLLGPGLLMIGSGVIFLGMIIWSFFIDSD